MPDIVVSGATGFIGSVLLSAFAAAGIDVQSYRDFRDGNATAATFVHCSNIIDDPVQNAALVADILTTIGRRVERFVQPQTFATLHGAGALDARHFNFGKAPLLMAPYAHGKLLQERVLVRAASSHPHLAIRLIYLPAVLGGGPWARHLDRARQHGVLLPPLMSRGARANYVHVSDLADHLLDTRFDVVPGITRTILNRPDSREMTWPDFFAGSKVLDETSPKSLIKLAVTIASLMTYQLRSRLVSPNLPSGQVDQRGPRSTVKLAPDVRVARPLRFDGLIQQIVRLQPYLAAR